MFKQLMAIVFLIITEWGLAYWYLWYKTIENAPQWQWWVVVIVLGALNLIILNLYANGKIEELHKR